MMIILLYLNQLLALCVSLLIITDAKLFSIFHVIDVMLFSIVLFTINIIYQLRLLFSSHELLSMFFNIIIIF
jgi:hypothetical protein